MKIKLFFSVLLMISLGLGLHFLNNDRDDLHLRVVPFNRLPGWEKTNALQSLHAFNISCKNFLKLKPDTQVGSPYIKLTAKDWYPACRAALSVKASSPKQAKMFFEHWFKPVEFVNHKPVQGLFTGYYLPLLHGSLTKTSDYSVPLYQTPNNLFTIDLGLFDPALAHRQLIGRLDGKKLVPYYTRKEINEGSLSKSASVLVWVNSHIDRLFLEIQGSGIVELPDGSQMYVGYANQNGARYTPLARVLIQKGVMTKENASMQGIREYLETHLEEMESIINQNESFVFFKKQPEQSAFGVQKIALTPGYSLAIDRRWVPIGTPIWLNTTHPAYHSNDKTVLQRLMIAQDTGGAIRGMVRGDVFWGPGDAATEIAGKMKNPGYYWLLLPTAALHPSLLSG